MAIRQRSLPHKWSNSGLDLTALLALHDRLVRQALDTSRAIVGTEVHNTHGLTFPDKPPVYASFYRTEATVAMCDSVGEHRSFSGMRTVQGFIAPDDWQPDLTNEPIEWGSDYHDAV